MSWTETIHDTGESLAESLAGTLEAAIRAGIETRGRAVLALAGGGTPLPAYRRLAKAALDWSRVYLLATDERWVDHDHPASNDLAMREAFMVSSGVHVMPLVPHPAGARPSDAPARATLASLAEPFDAVLLGMGADGHFASLFPGSTALRAGLDPEGDDDALVVHPDPLPPEAPFARVSLSAARLLRTRRLLLAVTGDAKRDTLDEARLKLQPERLPISALLHADAAMVEIHWSP